MDEISTATALVLAAIGIVLALVLHRNDSDHPWGKWIADRRAPIAATVLIVSVVIGFGSVLMDDENGDADEAPSTGPVAETIPGGGQRPRDAPVEDGCSPFLVYAQNRWSPAGANVRAEPDHNSTKVAALPGNTPVSVNAWTIGTTPIPVDPPPFNSDVWYRLTDGSGWIAFTAVRGDLTDFAPDSPDGGPPAPMSEACRV